MSALSGLTQPVIDTWKVFKHRTDEALEAAKSGLHKISSEAVKARNNTEILTKIVQVVTSVLSLLAIVFAKPALEILNPTLNRAINVIFSGALFTWLKKIFYPVTAEKIDPQGALDAITNELDKLYGMQNQLEMQNPLGMQHTRPALRFVANKVLKEVLDSMSGEKGAANRYPAFSSAEDFAKTLNTYFQKLGHRRIQEERHDGKVSHKLEAPDEHNPGIDFSKIDLSDVKIPLIKTTFTEKLKNLGWILSDLTTTFAFLKITNLIDTSKFAASLGRLKFVGPHIARVLNAPIMTWVSGFIVGGYVLNLVDCAKRAWEQHASKQPVDLSDRKKLLLDTISSVGELVYHSMAFVAEVGVKCMPLSVIYALSAIARTISIVCIYKQPEAKYLSVLKTN